MTTATAQTDITPETERPVLRRLRLSDAPAVQRPCDNRTIAFMTSRLPHPHPLDCAVKWIGGQEADFHRERPFAVTLDGEPIGSAGLGDVAESFEPGYWIGGPWWGRVLAKCGFRHTGRDKEYSLARGAEVDCKRVVLKREDGRAAPAGGAA